MNKKDISELNSKELYDLSLQFKELGYLLYQTYLIKKNNDRMNKEETDE